MNGDDNVRRHHQATGHRCRRWAFSRMVVVVEEELLSVDGVQIEHQRLLMCSGAECSILDVDTIFDTPFNGFSTEFDVDSSMESIWNIPGSVKTSDSH